MKVSHNIQKIFSWYVIQMAVCLSDQLLFDTRHKVTCIKTEYPRLRGSTLKAYGELSKLIYYVGACSWEKKQSNKYVKREKELILCPMLSI